MKYYLFLLTTLSLFIACSEPSNISSSDLETKAVRQLVENWFPEYKESFSFDIQKKLQEDLEFFEISSLGEKIHIVSNSRIGLASGLNWYIKEKCNVNISINDTEANLPEVLPKLAWPIRQETTFARRNFFNYCTFGYTMPWWDWNRWDKMIDWMAMNGVNMPLAITGQEAVWQQLLHEQGLSDSEIKSFIVGPAFLPWGWMGNIDGMAGPIPDSWISSHKALQKKILEKQRDHGMTPILQGFTGHIPEALTAKNPNLKYIKTTDWAGMPGTFFLDPTDPLFKQLGKRFIEIQTEMYGTDHLYDADCFNEINPPSKDTTFISNVSRTVFEGMTEADPEATWVMQGWFLFWQKDFWQAPQAKALLDAVPREKLILLDLYGEKYPVWDDTEAFYGKPWIWNVICNNGQKVNMSGDLTLMHENFQAAITSDSSGDLQGIGVMMEGFGYNPIIQDYVSHITFDPLLESVDTWADNYASRRYNDKGEDIKKAWKLLRNSVYARTELSENIICYPPGRMPDVSENKFGVNYNGEQLIRGSKALLDLAPRLAKNEHYQFDLVHTFRELLSLRATVILDKSYKALEASNLAQLENSKQDFVALLEDLDKLLGTHKLFLLGKWIEDAKSWGTNPEEVQYFASNAKSIVTLWQPSEDTNLRDYASRQWNGLVGDFYMHRWMKFFDEAEISIKHGTELDYEQLNKELIKWELNWINSNQSYPSKASGNTIDICHDLWTKYGN